MFGQGKVTHEQKGCKRETTSMKKIGKEIMRKEWEDVIRRKIKET
jgi:hypothetical protein